MIDLDKNDFLENFNDKGFYIVDSVLTKDFIDMIKIELKEALRKEVEFMGTEKYKFYGYVLSNAKYGGLFLDIFNNNAMMQPINWILGENSTIYSYTSSSLPPFKGNDSSHPHVDCPVFIKDYVLRMGLMLPLVDFTEENGATWFLESSHKEEKISSETFFYENADRLLVKAGSAFFFNTRLWHAGGKNKTDQWRHALTINFCRPWMKQYIDTPRLLEQTDLSEVSNNVLQKLGFYSQPPTSYEEYFDQGRKRLFL